MSTDEIYGPSIHKELFENSSFNPTNPYSASKSSAEMFINAYKHSYKLPIIIIRCNNVYGPKQFPEKVIPKFINQILENKSITIHGNGDKIRDFIYIDDVCNAVNIILLKGVIGEIYNIGIDNPTTINNMAKILCDKIKKTDIIYIQDRHFNDDRYYVNCDKIKNLGWKPEINLEKGLEYTIKWYINNKNYWINNINIFNDNRGYMKFINHNTYEQFISYNKKNVIRGIHCSPYSKTITCLNGSLIDYIVDFENITFEKIILKENNSLIIPANKGHLYITLEDNTQVLYQLHGKFDKTKERDISYRDPYINLDIPWNDDYILSDKDKNAPFIKPIDYAILGASGFLGSYTCDIMNKLSKNYIKLNTRLENIDILEKQLKMFRPKYLICAAGISGKPTVSWCENNKDETYYTNYFLQIQLMILCKKLNIYLVIYGSGLIYNKTGIYNEDYLDNINNVKLYYSKLRITLEEQVKQFDNILYLRFLYPIAYNKHQKCFLTKLIERKDNIHNIKINCSVLYDLIPKMFILIENNITGIYNFVNNGLISIPDIINIVFKKNIKFNIFNIENKQEPELDCNKLNNILINLKQNPVKNIYDALSIL
jgi:nucleoside-diphosphate-sugar epimerase/dTDP-4-dehydrorhamnose 3,5-epimerase-like enzyme